MPFIAGLTTQDPNTPVAWKVYALATLVRCVSVGNNAALTAWRLWAGGTTLQLWAQPPDSIASNVGAVTDGVTAIVAYAGTRDGTQLLTQIAGSAQIEFLPGRGRANAGQKLIWSRTFQAVANWLSTSIPAGGTVLVCGTSLGGACAALMSNYLRTLGYTCLVFTTGQPRVGDATFNGFVSTNWLRLINETDPVTTVPPELDTMNIVVAGVTQGQAQYVYRHGGVSQGVVLAPDTWADLVTPYAVSEAQAAGSLVGQFLSTFSFQSAFLQHHAIESYIQKISRLRDFPQSLELMNQALQQINATLNGILPQPPQPPAAPVLPEQQANQLQDPNVAIDNPPGGTRIPPADVGRRAEARNMGIVPDPPQFNTPILLLPQGAPLAVGNFIKCTFNFRQLGQAWSETYVHQNDTIASILAQMSTANPANRLIQQMGTSMMALRGPQCTLTSVRLSQFTLPVPVIRPRISYLYRFQPPIVGSYTTNPSDADFFDTCIVFQMTSAAGAPPKLTHARGFPDSYVTAGGSPVSDLATFFGAAWTSPQNGFPQVAVADQWHWVGRGTLREGVITNLVQDAAGTVTITTTTGTLLAGMTAGQVLPFRIKGVTKPRAINGVWPFVVNAGLLSLTTKKLFGILDWDTGSQGKIVYNPQQAYPITTVRFNNIGSRKAGRPSDLQRGRQPNRSRA